MYPCLEFPLSKCHDGVFCDSLGKEMETELGGGKKAYLLENQIWS